MEIAMPVAARNSSTKKSIPARRRAVRKTAAAGSANAKSSAKSTSVQNTQVIERATRWAGTRSAALTWFKTQAIPALGNRTAQDLVKRGDFEAVLFYLESMDAGAFA
jgi:hypothetical protein